MRGSTLKKIYKFVDILIANTASGTDMPSREELIKKMKDEWANNGKSGQKFVDAVITGKFDPTIHGIKK